MRVGRIVRLASLLTAFVAAQAIAGGENTPRPAWTLTADARALVDEMREQARAYRPHRSAPAIFSRGQLKYGAQQTDFLHTWYERPMHQNSEWAETADPRKILHPEAWKKTAEAVRLGGMEGLAVCLSQSRRSEVIPMSVMPGGEMTILVELPDGMNARGLEANLKTAAQALAMPNAFRIDGKVVLTRYPTIRDEDLDRVAELRRKFDEKFGPGKFITMFYVSTFDSRLSGQGPLTRETLEWAREHLRRCLRKMDGVFLAGWEVYWPRRYSPEFEREVLVPLYQSVLAEPEFAGKKYLGLPMTSGHENCYRWFGSIDSQGTRTLVERMRTMQMLRPDFLICCEWDEQDENTHFRPTISNGFTHPRILRHFSRVYAGEKPDRFPKDTAADAALPNVVLSYRKSIAAGDPLEVEALVIPDGTHAGERFAVSFAWKTPAGKVLKRFPAQTLAADELKSAWFISPATDLATAHRLVCPEVTIRTSAGQTVSVGAGLWPVDLNMTRALDAKWIKQSLREVARGVSGSFRVEAGAEAGTLAVRGEYAATSPVKSVEILEGSDTIHMAGESVRPAEDEVILKLSVHAGRLAEKFALSGTATFAGAPGVRIHPLGRGRRALAARADGWTFTKTHYGVWPFDLYATLPKRDVETATLRIDLAPTFQAVLRVKDIVEKDAVGIAGPAGGNLVVSRVLTQIGMPKPLGTTAGSFAFAFKPVSAKSVLRLQIVTADERVWRGTPQTLYRPSGTLREIHVMERDEERVQAVTADAALLDEPRYDFRDVRGSVLGTSAGRELWGILGGDVSLALGFGRGSQSCNGSDPIERHMKASFADYEKTAPTFVVEADGRAALQFDGCAYAVFPKQLVSKCAGFQIDLDVKPDRLEGRQTLVDTGNAGYGISLKDGVPEAFVWNTVGYARSRGAHVTVRAAAPLKVGEWNHVTLSFDQRELVLTANGVAGRPVRASCTQMQPRHTSLGAANGHPDFFHGRMANLTFQMK